jgi:hypothetical protein
MAMCVPFGGTDVHFDVTRPFGSAEADTTIKKIGASMGIIRSGLEDNKRLLIGSAEVICLKAARTPQEMEKIFSHVIGNLKMTVWSNDGDRLQK